MVDWTALPRAIGALVCSWLNIYDVRKARLACQKRRWQRFVPAWDFIYNSRELHMCDLGSVRHIVFNVSDWKHDAAVWDRTAGSAHTAKNLFFARAGGIMRKVRMSANWLWLQQRCMTKQSEITIGRTDAPDTEQGIVSLLARKAFAAWDLQLAVMPGSLLSACSAVLTRSIRCSCTAGSEHLSYYLRPWGCVGACISLPLTTVHFSTISALVLWKRSLLTILTVLMQWWSSSTPILS